MSSPKPFSRLTSPLRTPNFWQLQVAGWACVALITLPLKEVAYGSLKNGFLISLYYMPLGIVLSSGLRVIYRPLLRRRVPFWGMAAIVLGSCTITAAVDIWASGLGNRFMGIGAKSEVVGPGLYFFRGALYLCWSLIYIWTKAGIAARDEAFRASVAEERARLETLRYQLNPHFLFNTLTTICGEIQENPRAARDMAVQLAEFYRHTLRHVDREVPATLADEVELLRAYLDIEKLRLGSALAVNYDVDETVLREVFPPVLLLPLAENAIKYGGATSPRHLKIAITVKGEGAAAIRIEVANSGRLLETGDPKPASTRVGLNNLRARLEHYYAGRHTFALVPEEGWVRAKLELKAAV